LLSFGRFNLDIILVDLPLRMQLVAPLNLAILKTLASELGFQAKCVDFSIKYNTYFSKVLQEAGEFELLKKISAFRESSKVIAGINFLKDNISELAARIADEISVFDAKVVGITTRADSCYLALEIAKRLPGKVVLGGPGVYFSHKYLARYSFVKSIFVGRAEETFPKFLPKLVRGERVPKIIYGDFDFSRPIVPDYSDFDLSNYSALGIETQSGCVNSCKYCSARAYMGSFKLKPIRILEEEVKELAKYRKLIYLCDNIPNPTKRRIIEVCKLFHKYGLKFFCNLAPDIDGEVAYWLSLVCTHVTLGLESFSDDCLELMGRRYRFDQMIRSLTWLKRYGIRVHGMFFFGFPGEKLTSTLRTCIRILKHQNLMDTLALSSYILTYNSYVHLHPEEFGVKILRDGEVEAVLNAVPYEMSFTEKIKNKVRKFIVDVLFNYFDEKGKIGYWDVCRV